MQSKTKTGTTVDTVAESQDTPTAATKRRRRSKPKRKARKVSAARDKASKPISFRLTAEGAHALNQHVRLNGKRSKSHVIRLAVEQYVARSGLLQVPTSIGVVDGIYGATVHDDVVELANLLQALNFAVLNVAATIESTPEVNALHSMLNDAHEKLLNITGRINRKAP